MSPNSPHLGGGGHIQVSGSNGSSPMSPPGISSNSSTPGHALAQWNASNWTLSQQQQHQSQTNPGYSSKVKCVFIGDGAVGKTSLIISYTTNGYPSEYIPTAIDTYDVVVNVNDEPVTFEMCDTPGQSDFDNLRPLCYPKTDVFLICFSVVLPSSFTNIKEKWIPEIRRSFKGKGVVKPLWVLVGTQSDLREDATTLVELAKSKESPVTEQEARKLATNFGFQCYIECSSLTQKNLKEVFDEAIVAGLKCRKIKEKKRNTNQNPRGCASCNLL